VKTRLGYLLACILLIALVVQVAHRIRDSGNGVGRAMTAVGDSLPKVDLRPLYGGVRATLESLAAQCSLLFLLRSRLWSVQGIRAYLAGRISG
jgi:hypothetical protein